MKKAQSSLEFLISLAMLLLLLIGMYELSFDMVGRKNQLLSQFEGEKTAARLASAANWAFIAGPGAGISVVCASDPEQRIVASQIQVLSFGAKNRTLAIYPSFAPIANVSFNSSQTVNVSFNGTNVSMSALN
jgi:hypothetical protein